MMAIQDGVTYIRRGRAGIGPSLYLAASYDKVLREQEYTYPSSCLFQYAADTGAWLRHDVAHYVTAICPTVLPDGPVEVLVSISAEGEVLFKRGDASPVEQIPEAGMYNDQTRHRGRMYGVRLIGGRLHACGEGGQLYRRDGPNRWTTLDPDLGPMDGTALMEELDRNADDIDKLLGVDLSPLTKDSRRKSFIAINGLSEQEVYVCGYDGSLVVWDGDRTRWLDVPKTQLLDIFVEDERTVWVCGSQGTLVRGNHRDGFRDVSPGGMLTFNSMTLFGGKLWLSANSGFGGIQGVFTFDGTRLEQVSCGLTPDLEDVHSVDAAAGLLWVVGVRDILCFDGKVWTRIDHPDNPPVR